MKVYEARLKELLKTIGISYAIGLIVAILLALIAGGATPLLGPDTVLITAVVGSAVGIFMVNKSEVRVGILNTCIKMASGLFGTIFSAGFGSVVGLMLFMIKLVCAAVVGMFLLLFAVISFPVTIVYTLVMFLIERYVGEIPGGIGSMLDQAVPLVVVILIVMFLTNAI